jgi:hypothetical protein
MKLKFFIPLIVFLTVVAVPGRPQQAEKPLTKDQVMGLAKAGMETPELVKLIHEHGIDFDLADDYLQALRQAGAQEPVIQALRAARPKPLTKEQVLQLVAGHVPSQRAAALVGQHGIDFLPDEQYFEMLRLAGANDELIAALREASAAVAGQLVVLTSPGADVYLDGAFQGKANAQGGLVLKAPPGAHGVRISLAGMKDFEQSLTLVARQATTIEARLEAITAELVVVTSPGAEVYLDGEPQGKVGAQGNLAMKASLGTHKLKVSLGGKKDFERNVMLVAQQATRIEARLEDINPPELAKPTAPLIDWATQAISLRGRNGEHFAYTCPPRGTLSGPVWGTGLYSDDSSVCAAAVHAGLITPEQGGEITLEIRPGAGSYQGSTRNGVSTRPYARWLGSFAFPGQSRGPSPEATTIDWATPAVSLRGRIGERFVYICPPGGSLSHAVWGTGVYTDDSSICTAAVHAGVITPGQGGKITFEIRPGARAYQGSKQNGVSSRSYHSWVGSFVFVP